MGLHGRDARAGVRPPAPQRRLRGERRDAPRLGRDRQVPVPILVLRARGVLRVLVRERAELVRLLVRAVLLVLLVDLHRHRPRPPRGRDGAVDPLQRVRADLAQAPRAHLPREASAAPAARAALAASVPVAQATRPPTGVVARRGRLRRRGEHARVGGEQQGQHVARVEELAEDVGRARGLPRRRVLVVVEEEVDVALRGACVRRRGGDGRRGPVVQRHLVAFAFALAHLDVCARARRGQDRSSEGARVDAPLCGGPRPRA